MLRLKRIWEKELKLKDHIEAIKPKKLLICSGHGLGDQLMLIEPIRKLMSLYPNIEFSIALQKGLGFEELENDFPCKCIFVSDMSYDKNEDYGYDIIADLDFPMNEGQIELTKGQFCCKNEIGIEPNEVIYPKITCGKNRLILCQFVITCLPDSCNADEKTAKMIWDDVLEMGFIPLEFTFQHCFHNPKNALFPFVTAHVRKCRPQISSLVGLVESCAGVITVVTGNLHVALSILPPQRIFFLEKDFKLASFTKEADKVAKADLRKYNHEVKQWLLTLE